MSYPKPVTGWADTLDGVIMPVMWSKQIGDSVPVVLVSRAEWDAMVKRDPSRTGSKGGKKRGLNLTKQELTAIAKKGAAARWGKKG